MPAPPLRLICIRAWIVSGTKGRCKIAFFRSIAVAISVLAANGAQASDDLTLRMPESLIQQGFDKHILPRFKFKHRITIVAIAEAGADMTLGTDGAGVRVFEDIDGRTFGLQITTPEAEAIAMAKTFLGWLESDPGKAAIEGFQPDGIPLFKTALTDVEVEEAEVFDGDIQIGGKLALFHCGRCHVVDQRNRMGGIGSTPSFAALRGRDNWSDLFRAFYTQNPHPSFTQVEGVTEPFNPNRQIHIAPVEVTLDQIEAITAFVATITPKDLGRPIQAN
jgi:mono/diheme cytochrome c family protein